MLRPAAHQLQVTLASNLHTPADRSTARGKASARAAPRSTSTSKQSTCPVRCQPLQLIVSAEQSIAQDKASARAAFRRTSTSSYAGGGSQHASWPKHCPRQGQCLCCTSQQSNFNAAHPSGARPPRRNSSCQRSKVLPKARQVLMLLPAAHQLQATLASNLHTPTDRSTAQDKASARAAPRGTPTSRQSTHPVRCHRAAAFHARGTAHCPRQGKCSCCVPQHTNFKSR